MNYISLDKYCVKHRGTVFIVKNEKERNRSNNDLLGSVVTIDGIKHKVRGVESFAKATPIGIGENIGLLVLEVAKIGDTVRTFNGSEFVVLSQEVDNRDEGNSQYVWSISEEEYTDDMIFSPCDYGVPNQNFMIVKRA